MSWHGLWYLRPTTKRITLFRGFGLGRYLSTIFNRNGLIFGSIHNIFKRIRANLERAINRYIMSWHGLWYLRPTTKRITLFRGFGLGRYLSTIFNRNGLIFGSIHNIFKRIRVDLERAINRYIMGWHSLWYLRPTAKRITLFHGFSLGRYLCAIFNHNDLILNTI